MTLSDLDAEHAIYQELADANKKIREEQEDMIQSHREKAMPLIEWYRKNDFIFTHPDIGYRYAKGPILGLNSDENELIVYSPDKGFRKINLYNNEESATFIPNIIKEGHFESTINGFRYLEDMLQKYSLEMQKDNQTKTSELEKFK